MPSFRRVESMQMHGSARPVEFDTLLYLRRGPSCSVNITVVDNAGADLFHRVPGVIGQSPAAAAILAASSAEPFDLESLLYVQPPSWTF